MSSADTGYYDEFSEHDPPWRRVGWRQAIEQAYRFEAALELVRSRDGVVLDVGAGLGALAAYASETGLDREWWAVERRPEFANVLRQSSDYARVFEKSFEDVADIDQVNAAVAVGVLSSTTATRVAELAAYLARAPASMFTLLNRQALEGRLALGLEHLPAASTLEAARQLRPDGHAVIITTTDIAVFRPADVVPRSVHARFQATLDGPWGDVTTDVAGWLAVEIGLWDEAEHYLAQSDSELADIARQRLALNRAGDAEDTP